MPTEDYLNDLADNDPMRTLTASNKVQSLDPEEYWKAYKKRTILDPTDQDVYIPIVMRAYADAVRKHTLLTLASAMKKVLPDATLDKIIACADPLEAFLRELRK